MRKFAEPFLTWRVFVLLGVPLVLILIWFRGGGIVASSESGLFLYDSQRAYGYSSSIFADFSTGASFPTFLPRKTLSVALLIADSLGIPINVFQGLVFYILMASAVIAIYFLVQSFYSKETAKNAGFFSALFYLLNPFVMSQVWRRSLYPQYFMFALLPLSLLVLVYGLKTKKIIFVAIFALVSFLFSTAFGLLTNIIVFWSVLGLYAFVDIVSSKEKKVVWGKCVYFLGIFIFWVLVSLWWLLPIFGTTVSSLSANINGSEDLYTLFAISSFATPGFVLRLLQGFVFYSSSSFGPIYQSFAFSLLMWLLPIVAVLGILKSGRNRKFIFLLALLAVGFFVSIGSNPPFGGIFVWFFKKFSFLQAFRNPYEKFGLVFVLSYSVFFGVGMAKFFELKGTLKRALSLILVFIVCGMLVWPMWTGKVVNIAGTATVKVPQYYADINDYIKRLDGDSYRLLVLPVTDANGVIHHWPGGNYQGVDSAPNVFRAISVNSSYAFKMLEVVRRNLCTKDLSPFYSLVRAKYVVERKDVVNGDYYNDECYTNKVFVSHANSSIKPSLCKDMPFGSQADGSTLLECSIPKESWDFQSIKYINVVFNSDKIGDIEVAITDGNGWRQRWNSKTDANYRLPEGERILKLPLHYATEIPTSFDYSRVVSLEIIGYDGGENGVEVSGVALDKGVEQDIDEFNMVGSFGELTLFEPKNFYPVKQFGLVSRVDEVQDFDALLSGAEAQRKNLDRVAFVVNEQNRTKNYSFKVDSDASENQVLVAGKTKYWASLSGEGERYLLLSNTFDPNWVAIPNVSSNMGRGGLFDDLELLRITYLPENDHYTANGYANLWVLPASTKSVLVIYRPQLYVEVGWFATTFITLLCAGYSGFYLARKVLLKKTPSN